MGANQQMLMSLGASLYPGTAEAVYMFSENTSIRNSAANAADYFDEVYTIQDVTGNGHNIGAGSARLRFLKVVNGQKYFFRGAAGSAYVKPSISADAAWAAITGNFAWETDCALADWTPSGEQVLSTNADGATNATWVLKISATGNLIFQIFSNSVTFITLTATAPTGLADNVFAIIRFEWIQNTGSGQYRGRFYANGVQVGADLTGASPPNNNSAIAFPIIIAGFGITPSFAALGRFYAFRLYNASNTLITEWVASDSVHFASSGPCRTGSSTITYNNSGYDNAGLIGRSVGYALAASPQYQISTTITPTGDVACVARIKGKISTGRMSTFGTSTAGTAPTLGIVFDTPQGIFQNNMSHSGGTVTLPLINRDLKFITKNVGSNFLWNVSGTTGSAAATPISPTGVLDRFPFRSGENTPAGVFFDRWGCWRGSNILSDAAYTAWLG